MKPALILLSHGQMARETLLSAQMIVGEIPNVQTVCMAHEDGLTGITKKLEEALSGFDSREPVLLMADLMGGTPCNVAAASFMSRYAITLVTGFNLAMVIEYADNPESDPALLAQSILEIGRDAIENVDPSQQDDDDEIETES